MALNLLNNFTLVQIYEKPLDKLVEFMYNDDVR